LTRSWWGWPLRDLVRRQTFLYSAYKNKRYADNIHC